jgi:hypothetical protein
VSIEFEWNNNVTCHFTKEKLPVDSLGRSEQASYLTDYLSLYKNDSYVLNLNSEWGSGKTYFLKRWANSIKDKHPVIYFDAWSNDFHNEPLTLILSEIIQQLKSLIKGPGKKDKIDGLFNKAGNVLKATAPELAKGLVKALVKVDIDDVSERIEATQTENSLANTFSSATKNILNLHKQQQVSVIELKQTIEQILQDVICKDNIDDKKRWSPLYVFIDELDRCRPTFAIELLEIVKHIFSMKQVIFVIATDTGQLQHSIKAVYGSGFDSTRYLGRFFDRSFTLSQPDLYDFIKTLPNINTLFERIIETNDLNIIDWDEELIINFIAILFEGFGVDLRTVSQVIERIASILIHNKGEQSVIWLLLLETIRVFSLEAFNALITGNIYDHDNSTHEYFFIPMNDKSKSKLDKVLITPELSSNWTRSGLDNVTIQHNQQQRTLKTRTVKYDAYTLNKLIMLAVNFYSTSPPDYISSLDINIFDLYFWKTQGDLKRYQKYIEVAAKLA